MDSCMCPGDQCPVKNQCYRYRALPDITQPYFRDIPFDFENHECAGFKFIDKTAAPVRHLDDKSWDLIVANDRKLNGEIK